MEFKDDDAEHAFRLSYHRRSTPVFRRWLLLFVIFQAIVFFARDFSTQTTSQLLLSLYIGRIPSIVIIIFFYMITYTSLWEKVNEQVGVSVGVAVVLSLMLTLTLTLIFFVCDMSHEMQYGRF